MVDGQNLPAFPMAVQPDYQFANNGMSLRDWFAGLAMQGIVGSIDGEPNYQRLRNIANVRGMVLSGWIAREAYKQADALLAARQEPQS